MTTEPHIYLASGSPRRGQLLEQIGVRFRLVPAPVVETRATAEAPEHYVRRLAMEKARDGHSQHAATGDRPTLGADTAVVLADRVLGKPRDAEDAVGMLTRLSGQEHRVLTAVALKSAAREVSCVQESRVRFRRLSLAECRRYVATGEPMDKAGAYAVQGLAAVFIERLEGSYSGVMGLPLFETWQMLVEFGVDVDWR